MCKIKRAKDFSSRIRRSNVVREGKKNDDKMFDVDESCDLDSDEDVDKVFKDE